MKPLRIESIHLDEDHNVAGITAVVDAPYLPALNAAMFLRPESRKLVVRSERGDTELWLSLNCRNLLDLFRAAGKWTGETELVPGVYDALAMVVYGLMED